MESSLAEEHLGSSWAKSVNISQQRALMAQADNNSLLGCTEQSIASRSRGVIPPLPSALVRHPWNAVFSSGLPSNRETETYWSKSSERPGKRPQTWQHLTSVERLRELGLFCLEERRLQSEPLNLYKYPVGGNEEDGARPFSAMPTVRRRANGHKLKHSQF